MNKVVDDQVGMMSKSQVQLRDDRVREEVPSFNRAIKVYIDIYSSIGVALHVSRLPRSSGWRSIDRWSVGVGEII